MTLRSMLVVVLLAAGLSGALAQEDRLVVFAAASMKTALDAVNAACATEVGEAATISYAGSSALARQIEAGAPADLFISADLDWMTYLSDRKLVRAGTETRLLGNRIVLVAPASSTVSTTITTGFDLSGLLSDGRLAMANVDAVPAGKYGKAALEALGVWASVADKVAQAENVRAALALVSTGEAPLGIVYHTDAHSEAKVKSIAAFPADSHPPIVYPVAITASSTNPDVEAFFDFLRSDKAKPAYQKQGFTVLAPAS